jgi:hypothetical protein
MPSGPADPRPRDAPAPPQQLSLFGSVPDAPVGEPAPDALRDAHAPPREACPRESARRHATARPGRDLHGRRRDGSRIPLELSLSPIGREGETTMLAAVVDLSARQAQQDLLAAALREQGVPAATKEAGEETAPDEENRMAVEGEADPSQPIELARAEALQEVQDRGALQVLVVAEPAHRAMAPRTVAASPAR